MLERARKELAQFYPPDPDGSVPVAYLWSRTVACPNCHAEMPLIRQYWLARKDKKKVALQPVIDHVRNRVDFEVVEGSNIIGNPAKATTSRGDTLCLLCRQVVKATDVRSAAQHAGLGSRMIAVVLEAESSDGKGYRGATTLDLTAFANAEAQAGKLEGQAIGDLPLVPDEPIDPDHHDVNRPVLYGDNTWGKLFNARQLLALTTFAGLVREAHAEMLRAGVEEEYAKAVATYLGFAVDRLADYNCTLSVWVPGDGNSAHAFSRQALPMVWDYCEVNSLVSTSGSWSQAMYWVGLCIDQRLEASTMPSIAVTSADARASASPSSLVVTDPPYYDSINYADLSDFFYVWLKRSVGSLHPELFSLPLTPKKDQIVMNVYAKNDAHEGEDRKSAARRQYVEGMAQSFQAMGKSLEPDGLVGIVFAHSDPDAWATLIEGLLQAGLSPNASWPIDTEREGKVSNIGQARLKTSVWMACRARDEDAGEAFLGDVLEEMRPVINERLLYFWSKGIRGADFFISAIGPALSVFGRHGKVLRPDGTEVTVRDFLDIVRRESTRVALEQVLQGADLGVVDPVTRQYVTWVWSYSRAPLDAGEAIALCLATGVEYSEAVRPNSIVVEAKEKSKKVVKLRTIRERGREDENLGDDTPGRPAPLIDQLQRAALFWGQNQAGDLATYRGALTEARWSALRVLGQAVAECLPEGDEDRRLIHGLLGSNVMAKARAEQPAMPQTAPLPGFDEQGGNDA